MTKFNYDPILGLASYEFKNPFEIGLSKKKRKRIIKNSSNKVNSKYK